MSATQNSQKWAGNFEITGEVREGHTPQEVEQAIYAEIDKLEKTEADVKKFAQHTELFAWLITLGIVLLTAEIALGQTVLRRLP